MMAVPGADSHEKVVELHPPPEGEMSVLSSALPRPRGKPRGHARPPGSGRAKGTRNKRTIEIEMLLRPTVPAARRRLRAIINDPKADPDTVLRAVQLLFAYVFGRPIDRKELSGPDGGAIVSALESGELGPTREVARRIAFLMGNAVRADGGEMPSPAPEAPQHRATDWLVKAPAPHERSMPQVKIRGVADEVHVSCGATVYHVRPAGASTWVVVQTGTRIGDVAKEWHGTQKAAIDRASVLARQDWRPDQAAQPAAQPLTYPPPRRREGEPHDE